MARVDSCRSRSARVIPLTAPVDSEQGGKKKKKIKEKRNKGLALLLTGELDAAMLTPSPTPLALDAPVYPDNMNPRWDHSRRGHESVEREEEGQRSGNECGPPVRLWWQNWTQWHRPLRCWALNHPLIIKTHKHQPNMRPPADETTRRS